jgi:LytS/YehU family sensor histidine kinase
MMSAFFVRQRLLLLHLSFWLLYITYRTYDLKDYVGYPKAFIYVGLPLVFTVVASYVHYFFLLPQLLVTKRLMPYAGKLLFMLAVIVAARILAENVVMPTLLANEKYYQTIKLTRIISIVWDTLTFLIFTGMIRFTTDWFDLENKKKQLENEKLHAELNYLKAQINPHFLFNTLHNLNYLIYSKADSATEVVIKLSNIMRYMIYDANKDRVPLQKEIDYIHDYIDLERIRLNYPFTINFTVVGAVASAEIAPLILLTFMENAFKHGVSDQQQNCTIDVSLVIDDRQIYYSVSNTKMKTGTQQKLKSGFGLQNVQQRLELSYADRHKLVLTEDETTYTIALTLAKI